MTLEVETGAETEEPRTKPRQMTALLLGAIVVVSTIVDTVTQHRAELLHPEGFAGFPTSRSGATRPTFSSPKESTPHFERIDAALRKIRRVLGQENTMRPA
jgi:hypothetical protein